MFECKGEIARRFIPTALILAAFAGTPAAWAQTATKKAKAPAAQTTGGTATFTNQPPVPQQTQPSMQSAFGKQPQPAAKPPPPAAGANHAGKAKAPRDDINMHIDENNIVDLHVNDEDLSAVLEMLSIQSQRNIVASKNVSARVTANLYGVTFYEALDAILNVNGYGYIEDGNFLYVYTLEEIGAIEKTNRVRVSKVISLSYLSSLDAAEFSKPLLSETGQIKTNGKTGSFPSLGDTPQGNEEYALSSTLVVYDYEENLAEIEALIKQIDTRPSQVLVEATILQTTLNEANAFGVDFAIVSNMAFGDFVQVGGPLVGPNALIGGKAGSAALPADGSGTALSSTVGGTAGPGGLKIGIVSNDVSVFLRVLDEVTDSTVLSNPKLLALNRQGARVLVGRKVGYLSTTSTDTATTQTVEFLDTGTQLYFRPFVDTVERTIRMELKPQVSEAVIREVNNATGASLTIPDEITNELSTNVMVRDGQTIVLGGLFRESTVSTRRQLPILGDIPLIGRVFRGNDDTTQRTEIIFLITPTIINDTALAEAGQRGNQLVRQAQAGAREGTLKWSRDRLTTQLNVEAQKLAAAGDTEKALWKVERSLSLDSSQPEMIAMREKLTGQKSPWPSRSGLRHIIYNEADTAVKKRAGANGSTDSTEATQVSQLPTSATPTTATTTTTPTASTTVAPPTTPASPTMIANATNSATTTTTPGTTGPTTATTDAGQATILPTTATSPASTTDMTATRDAAAPLDTATLAAIHATQPGIATDTSATTTTTPTTSASTSTTSTVAGSAAAAPATQAATGQVVPMVFEITNAGSGDSADLARAWFSSPNVFWRWFRPGPTTSPFGPATITNAGDNN